MRIGMMADAYKPHISGITNVIALSKQFLEKAGYEVYVFTFGGGDYIDDEPNIIRTRGVPLVDTGLYLSARHSTDAQKILQKMRNCPKVMQFLYCRTNVYRMSLMTILD